MMEVAGYIAALLIGVSLGLIGGGGSILTVPVLVYLFKIPPLPAISYSLFIVGFSSLVGAARYYRKGLVNTRTALLFGSTSITTVFITRKFIVPFLPDVLFSIGSFTFTQSLLTMILFALLMIAASFSMIRNKQKIPDSNARTGGIVLILYGILIGLITGFLGAGGGFLIIPALVLIMKMEMKEAVGTSLLIIALNSLTGFAGDINHYTTDWQFLLIITSIAASGIFIGSYLNRKVNASSLKKGFGWFILIMGIYIIGNEIF